MKKSNLRNPFPFLKLIKLPTYEVLRTPVRYCELKPIELIWAQVKGFVAENNTPFHLKDVKELVFGGGWQNYKGSLGEGSRPCIKNRKGVWERELH